jgi:hypothetical protein
MSWTTVEVRWFYPGVAPERVATWFTQDDGATEVQPPRVDRYLRLVGRDGLGIKLREGRIEIKQRHASTSTALASEVVGLVERWTKWGYGLAEEADNDRTAEQDAAWVSVEKRRWVRTYRIADDGAIELTSRSLTTPRRECSAELARVEIEGQAWWTLGFEAAGDEATLRTTLETVARHVLADMAPPALDLAHSYGYPRWLRSLGS